MSIPHDIFFTLTPAALVILEAMGRIQAKVGLYPPERLQFPSPHIGDLLQLQEDAPFFRVAKRTWRVINGVAALELELDAP
jgi:hypothetical protein